MNNMKEFITAVKEMRTYLILWLTQSFSGLGSAMTSYALVIWSYNEHGSALMTALLMVSSYAPYVVFSIFAGALSDRWDKKATMLSCDFAAAATTVIMLVLLKGDRLRIWHLYFLNMLNGLMNTVQQPASEVAVTRVLPKKYYQRVGGLKYFAASLNSIMTPIIATAVLGLAGMEAVAAFDLFTFGVAFVTLAFCIKIPGKERDGAGKEKLLAAAGKGIAYLRRERGIFQLILFLAAINLVASVYEAAFPAMMLSREGGGEKVLGLVNAVIGLTTFAGSILASFMKAPKSRVKVICRCPAVFHEHGEFPAGIWKDAFCVVPGRLSGVDCHSSYEHEPGRHYAASCAGGYAGEGVLREKFPAVFYHSRGVFPGRLPGGRGL